MHLHGVLGLFGVLAALITTTAGTPNDQAVPLKPNPLQVRELRKQLLYPYPKDHLQKDIKNQTPQLRIQFNFNLPFFGLSFNHSFVSLSGVLKFSQGSVSTRYPLRFPIDDWPIHLDPAFIAPFFAQALIGQGDNAIAEAQRPPGVYVKVYKNIGASLLQEEINLQEAIRLDVLNGIIGTIDFNPKHIIIVTWKNVTFKGGISPKKTNTYQLMITTDEHRTYAIFNYQNITWTTSTEAGGDTVTGLGGTPAFVGFNAGNGSRAFEYTPYSQNTEINILTFHAHVNGFHGRHIFRIDQLIQQGTCKFQPENRVLELTTYPERGQMLGGTVVNITGPCSYKGQTINVKFHDQAVTCIYHDENVATCVTPRIYTAGFVNVAALIDDGWFQFKNTFYIENPFLGPESVWVEEPLQLNSLDLTGFYLYWKNSSINLFPRKEVHISLWGYKETGEKAQLEFIRLLKTDVNSGRTFIRIADYANVDDGNKKNYTVGLIQVNGTATQTQEGKSLVATLWSRPIPLGWYFAGQWKKQMGPNWSRAKCQDWTKKEATNPRFDATSLPACPCSLQQATYDKTRFVPDINCDAEKNQQCYKHPILEHCVMSAQPNAKGFGQHCCYDFQQKTIVTPTSTDSVTSFPWRSHPFGQYPYDSAGKVPGLSHWFQDLVGYYTCCKWSNDNDTCLQFMNMRPTNDCTGYKRNNVSQIYGDPHFLTNDLFNYTFNGQGEFSLVNVSNRKNILGIQARFERYVDLKKHIQRPATIITAIAAKGNMTDTVEIQCRQKSTSGQYKLDVLVNQKRVYLDKPGMHIQPFKGVTVHTPSNIDNHSDIIVAFDSGAGVQVIHKFGYIAARIYLPESFMKQTLGLMGNWSNNISDDLVTPDGHIVTQPNPNALQTIHTDFGLHWMILDPSHSLFYPEHGRYSSFYNNRTFRPIFEKSPSILPTSILTEKDVFRTCLNPHDAVSIPCRYDYVVTEDKNLAISTLHFEREFYDQYFFVKSPRFCPALKPQPHMRMSRLDRKIDSVVEFGCASGYSLVGHNRTTCLPTLRWSPPINEKETRCVK